eukprot:gnl/MRDRNA2_/MRDRNA2_28825_c0_seq1.p1 gnl/MRDRNA2_/MRDRNA2_28825_c0~~gnl/MRDRNA2_/MRDRNA2_28825_c0_seq1.p1  ORF type:complete len:375 (-),score=64.02 gnl/MRDRNA2_/MRDRNA2_28825_c0_seq1:291-1415(-)
MYDFHLTRQFEGDKALKSWFQDIQDEKSSLRLGRDLLRQQKHALGSCPQKGNLWSNSAASSSLRGANCAKWIGHELGRKAVAAYSMEPKPRCNKACCFWDAPARVKAVHSDSSASSLVTMSQCMEHSKAAEYDECAASQLSLVSERESPDLSKWTPKLECKKRIGVCEITIPDRIDALHPQQASEKRSAPNVLSASQRSTRKENPFKMKIKSKNGWQRQSSRETISCVQESFSKCSACSKSSIASEFSNVCSTSDTSTTSHTSGINLSSDAGITSSLICGNSRSYSRTACQSSGSNSSIKSNNSGGHIVHFQMTGNKGEKDEKQRETSDMIAYLQNSVDVADREAFRHAVKQIWLSLTDENEFIVHTCPLAYGI